MAGPHFQHLSWTPFTYKGVTYSLNHLDEFEFTAFDTSGANRRIVVTFSDHCFTRKPAPGDDPAQVYPDSNRDPGYFCFIRYQLSLGLVEQIGLVAQGNVWLVEGNNFAILTGFDQSGQSIRCGIIFSLDRVTGLPVHLHMRVKTAFPLDVDGIVTHGKVGFSHLMKLRILRKMPRRQKSKRR